MLEIAMMLVATPPPPTTHHHTTRTSLIVTTSLSKETDKSYHILTDRARNTHTNRWKKEDKTRSSDEGNGGSAAGLLLLLRKNLQLEREQTNVGALIIRIGFWGLLIIIIVQYTPNPILIVEAPRLSLEGHVSGAQGFLNSRSPTKGCFEAERGVCS